MFDAAFTVLRAILGISIWQTLGFIKIIKKLYWTAYTQVWDTNLHIANQFAPDFGPKNVIRPGKPGANGECFLVPLHAYQLIPARRLVEVHVFTSHRNRLEIALPGFERAVQYR